VAQNGAGNSTEGAQATFYSCIAPSGLAAPYKGTVTATSVELLWADPLDDGGCGLYGFSIFRDDGAGGSFVEVHAGSVNGLPTLNQFTVTDLPASPLGKTVRFYIKAFNVGGYSVSSSSTSIVVATVPSTPLTAPASVPGVTSGSIIKITYTEPGDGGSTITNYEIQMDDGQGGGYVTVAGGDNQIHLYSYFHAIAAPRVLFGRSLTAFQGQHTYSVFIT